MLRWLEARLPILSFGYSCRRLLSDAAQPELLVDVRRHPHLHADGADRDRGDPGHALHAPGRHGLQFRRAHHARRELRLAACATCIPTAPRCSSSPSTSTCSAACITAPTRRRARCCGSSACIIYLLMMATGFMGYVLPWGQMSYWAATVITNLFSAIPVVGDPIVTWLWGGYSVGNPTLNRFFSLHYLLPFVIVGVVVLHIWALHVVGQNNPGRHRPQGGEGHRAVHALRHHQGRLRLSAVPDPLCVVRVLHPELSRPRRQLHPGQSGGDAGAHRAGMVLPAVLRDPALDPRTSCSA